MGLLSGSGSAAFKSVDRTNFTATAGQTTFTLNQGYSVGDVDIFLNGVRLVEGDDYFATNGSTVVLTSAAAVGDNLQVVSYNQFIAANTYTKAESDGRYMVATGQTPMTSYLRTPNYGVSSYSDSANASLEASVGSGEQGVGVKAFGRSVPTNGGDILYTTDSRGAGGRHRFGYWNGTTFTSGMTIDSAGRVLKPQHPCFDVASSAGVSDNTVQTYNTIYVNNGGHFSSNRFTAPVSGMYIFNAATIKSGGSTSTVGRLYLRKNGTVLYGSRHLRLSEGSTYGDGSCTWVVQLSASDYVDVFMNGNAGSHSSVEYTWFNGMLIG